jgi:hypothetical protein
VTSTSAVTTCSDRWQVFSTADHEQELYHFDIGLLHAWSKSHSQAILLNDKWEFGRRFQYKYSNLSLPLLISLLRKSLNHPYIFFTTEFITCLLRYSSIIQNTSLFLWPHRSSNRISVCFVIMQFFRSPHHFVSTELSQSSLCFVTAALSHSPLRFVTTALLNSSLCLSVFLAQHYYSSGVFVLLLQHCRRHLSVAWPQHSWGLLSVYVTAACLVSPLSVVCFFTQHYSSHPSVSLVTEEFLFKSLVLPYTLWKLSRVFLYRWSINNCSRVCPRTFSPELCVQPPHCG